MPWSQALDLDAVRTTSQACVVPSTSAHGWLTSSIASGVAFVHRQANAVTTTAASERVTDRTKGSTHGVAGGRFEACSNRHALRFGRRVSRKTRNRRLGASRVMPMTVNVVIRRAPEKPGETDQL